MNGSRVGFMGRQLATWRLGGWAEVNAKLRIRKVRFFYNCSVWINAIWAVPVVLLLRSVRPIVMIRFGSFDATRIGHFVLDSVRHFVEYRRQPPNTIDLFWFGPTCNTQWKLMVRRSLPIVQATRWLDLWNRRLPGGEEHSLPCNNGGVASIGKILETVGVGALTFLPSENDEALAWLRGKGWSDGEPFVCLLVRDPAFLTLDALQNKLNGTNTHQKWSYHNYRDSNIEDYVPSMEWLANQGVWVIRMGKIMERPIPSRHPRIIDYAFDNTKSDFLDVWLFANCSGCISTATGIDFVSCVYGVPNLFVNFAPLGGLWAFHEMVAVPKHLYWSETGARLTLDETLHHNYGSSFRYAEAGIRFADLDSDELMNAVQEFWKRVIGLWIESPEDQLLQSRFWTAFQAWDGFDLNHDTIHPQARVGAGWLRKMGEGYIFGAVGFQSDR